MLVVLHWSIPMGVFWGLTPKVQVTSVLCSIPCSPPCHRSLGSRAGGSGIDVPPGLTATGVSSWCPEPELPRSPVLSPSPPIQLGLPYPELLAIQDPRCISALISGTCSGGGIGGVGQQSASTASLLPCPTHRGCTAQHSQDRTEHPFLEEL